MREEIEAVVREETERCKAAIEGRVAEAVSSVTLQLHRQMSVETFKDGFTLTVFLPNAGMK